ncbi:pyruvate dehydrogenase (acetyl-transferring) E1 component subunit alpha [Marinobacterium jannaschii]|uniref:pyruvate dehydrogenase (acetyl-transferring) E1 component subunit alpha n=1 Tax=Marinobacterium jannaschii TaxID=64970 RepID=UPI0004899B5F|nr:pyruvate dehydrogenase (acetyl-transferring) E1 component subunit alpha [Marinobacterium jannaschii]
METVYQGEIRLNRYLDKEGTPLQAIPQWACEPGWLTDCYRNMVLARALDSKAIALQRTGQMGTYASLLGAEAIDVVCGMVMRQEDVLIPYYRNHASQMLRGMKMEEVMYYWGGDERGNAAAGAGEDFPNCVPIATQSLHACGVATAIKARGEKRVAVTMCGDGATSKGDFLEALNVAGAWQLPVVFIINNNQWAISVPRAIQCGAPTLAQKAIGAGIRGEQVDGNDAIAMREALQLALDRARDGKGPSVIEALSYRLSDHTTADDATRYRENAELKQAWEVEPIKRLRNYLHNNGWWDETQEQSWSQEVNQMVQRAAENYLASDTQPVETTFDYLYAELPDSLREQRDWAQVRAMQGGSHDE